MNASELVNCINSVKTELQGIGLGNVPVGTADSWNLWIDGRNTIVIQACDILLSNAFSVNIFLKRGLTKKYWQGQDISKNATHSFFEQHLLPGCKIRFLTHMLSDRHERWFVTTLKEITL